MKQARMIAWTVAAGLGLAAVVAATVGGGEEQHVMPPLPQDAAEHPVQLIAAQPFLLQEDGVHWYRAEQPRYDAGYLLVLGVDPDVVHPRQTLEPVLYVGAETAQRVNVGHESGHLVVIVPAPRDGRGGVALDLTRTPIFFGTPALPEEITAADAAAELARARGLGVGAPSPAMVQEALREAVSFQDSYELRLWAAELIEEFSPVERDLVEGLRVPRIGE